MRTVLLASLRTHTRRYVAALLAVTIAVGFVVTTDALASATKDGFSSAVGDAYPGADLVLGDDAGVEGDDLETALETAAEAGDRTAVLATGYFPVRADGRDLGEEVTTSTIADDPALRRQTLLEGRAPRDATEAVADVDAARSAGVGIGDTLTLGSGELQTSVEVVGLADGATYLAADVYVPWSTFEQMGTAFADAVVYDVSDGAVDARADALREAVGTEVRTRDAYVDARLQMVNQGVDVVSYLLLLFAAIAGFVAVLVIANTFTILFAQRTRDLALLRCVGATRTQVLRSVRLESLVLALVASATGVLGGMAAGQGIAALVRLVADDGRVGTVGFTPSWLVGAFVGGVVVTLVAAWLPTRAVVRVSPLAALRPSQDPTVGNRAGRVRVALGALAAAVGAVALAGAVSTTSMPLLMAGGMVSFVGVLLLGPVLVPGLLRLLGAALARTGPSMRIAAANAVRNPRRSATTTASLLVGVTLTTAVLTGMASARTAIGGELDSDHPVDASLVGTSAIDADVLSAVGRTRGVEEVSDVLGVVASSELGDELPVLAPTPEQRALTRDPAAVTAADDELLVPMDVAADLGLAIPERLTLGTDAGSVELRTRMVTAEWGPALVVAPGTLDELGGAGVLAAWVQADGGADADTLGGDLGAIATSAGLETTNGLEGRSYVELQLDVLVWAVLGLLGVGVAIALVGIANTVGLSVLERGREHALLRALGLTRAQLRRVLAAEGLLLALVAALLGTALGTLYGWLGTITVIRTAVADAPLVVPWEQLAAVVVAAALAGLAACVLPARRAARVAPAQGLTLD